MDKIERLDYWTRVEGRDLVEEFSELTEIATDLRNFLDLFVGYGEPRTLEELEATLLSYRLRSSIPAESDGENHCGIFYVGPEGRSPYLVVEGDFNETYELVGKPELFAPYLPTSAYVVLEVERVLNPMHSLGSRYFVLLPNGEVFSN